MSEQEAVYEQQFDTFLQGFEKRYTSEPDKVEIKDSMLKLSNICTTELEIKQVASVFTESFLTEFRSIDLIVFAKKLSVFSDELRKLSEQSAYAQADGEKNLVVGGCKVETTRPKAIYQYSTDYYAMEVEVKEEIDRLNKKLKATRELEESEGLAINTDYQKGTIRISIPKG